MAKITVIGAGGWGIALAVLLNDNKHEVTIFSCVSKELEMLRVNHENTISLPGIIIPDSIKIDDNIVTAVEKADIIVMSVASSYVRATARSLKGILKPEQIIIDVAKGIEDVTYNTMTQVIEEELPDNDVAILSGPSHAEEVGKKMPTTCVVGAHSLKTATYIQNVFMNQFFRVYTSPDMLGIELGGSLKNVIALAAGMADGMGCGDNTKAALITRGIAELSRLGVAMGGNFQTFMGLSGIGDLIVTCASMHSRNRRAGILIGQGFSMEDAMKEVNMVVEGVYSAKAAYGLSKKYNINMPIIHQVYLVLFENKDVRIALNDLMLRDKTDESKDLVWK